MADLPDHVLGWLQEIDRRTQTGERTDNRSLLAALHRSLPKGFRAADLPPGLRYGSHLSALGVKAIGDPRGLLPDVDRAIIHIRDLLLASPATEQVGAGHVAEALGMDVARAEQVLELIVSLGRFASGGAGGDRGFSVISVQGDDVFSDYLNYSGLEAAMVPPQPQPPPARLVPLAVPRASERPAEDPRAVFVVMSMDPTNPTLTDVVNTIKDTCAAFGLVATRVDDIDHDGPITEKILERIVSSRYIIADLTGERPNVYYEVGYAQALGKSPILVRAKGTKLHFDLSVHNVKEYENQTALRAILNRIFENILGRIPKPRAP